MAAVPDIQVPVNDIQEGLVARPGDTLVVAFERRLHEQERQEITDRLRIIASDVTVLVFDDGVHLSVLRKDDGDARD